MNFFEKIFGVTGLDKLVLGIIDRIKGFSPEDRAKLEQILASNQFELAKMQGQYEQKLLDVQQAEVDAATKVITAEAQSASWLPRNVRPFLLLCWGVAITLNAGIPIVARLWHLDIAPVALDPWVYKLTAIGYTGYVAFRSLDKVLGGEGGSVQLPGVKLDSKGDK